MKNWQLTEEFLENIPVPEKTEDYTPIPHGVFVSTLQEKIRTAGLEVASKRYLTNEKGLVLTGEYEIKSDLDKEMTLSIGFQNSYNKVKKASIYGGAIVLVCKNGMYTSKSFGRFSRKHTGDALNAIMVNIDKVIETSEARFKQLVEDREALKTITLRDIDIATLLGDMFLNQSIISPVQLNIIKDQMFNSQFFKERTAWSLYNWATEAFKNTHPLKYMSDHMKLHAYMSDVFFLASGPGLYESPLWTKVTEPTSPSLEEEPEYPVGGAFDLDQEELANNFPDLNKFYEDGGFESMINGGEDKPLISAEPRMIDLSEKGDDDYTPDPSKYQSLEEALAEVPERNKFEDAARGRDESGINEDEFDSQNQEIDEIEPERGDEY
jgi:hypothetical protein